jgi:hypothetical protein
MLKRTGASPSACFKPFLVVVGSVSSVCILTEMNGGRESRRPRPALGCSAIDDDDEGTGAKVDPQFKFSGKCENKRRIARVDSCSVSSGVPTRTNAGRKLPPVGRGACLRSVVEEGRLKKLRYANFLIFSYINGGKQLLLYIERKLI